MRAYEELQYDKWVVSLNQTMPALLERHLLVRRNLSTVGPSDLQVRKTSSTSADAGDNCE